jgi:outer membrane protein W
MPYYLPIPLWGGDPRCSMDVRNLGEGWQLRTIGLAELMVILVLAEVLVGNVAAADTSESRPGPYIAAGGAFGVTTRLEDSIELTYHVAPNTPPILNPNAERSSRVKEGWGAFGQLGFRFHPRLAVQANAEWISTFEVATIDGQRERPEVRQEIEEVSTWVATGDIRLFVLKGEVQPHLTVGVGAMGVSVNNESSEQNALGPVVTTNLRDGADFAARFGAGVDFILSEYVYMTLQSSYILPTGSVEDYDYVSIVFGFGIRY